MVKPIRIIVMMIEGDFMLLRDFPNFDAASRFVQNIGFSRYCITDCYDETEWQTMDASLDAEKVMSFAKQKAKEAKK
jgi:hypothetical protein